MRFCSALFWMLTGSFVFAGPVTTLHVERDAKTFSVCLPANPTTGYRWTVDFSDRTLIRKISEHYTSPSKRLGSGGETCFVFEKCHQLNSVPTTKLIFKYQRSWEPKPIEVRSIVVEFESRS